MSDIFDNLRAAGVTDFRFCIGNGVADSFPEDYPEEQRQIVEAVLASLSSSENVISGPEFRRELIAAGIDPNSLSWCVDRIISCPPGLEDAVDAVLREHLSDSSRERRERISAILDSLAALDAKIAEKVPRVIEDLSHGMPVHESVQAMFAEKVALRAELAALGGA